MTPAVSDIGHLLEDLASRSAKSLTVLGDAPTHTVAEFLQFARFDCLHRALELRFVGQEGRDLGLDGVADVFAVVWSVGLPHQQM